MKKNSFVLGIIGGSGIYDIDGFKDGKWIKIETPFGNPSDKIYVGTLNKIKVAFLPRHSRKHLYSPSTVPYQANIYALKSIGVTDVLSVSACGSLREDYRPGEMVLVDQFIDWTFSRKKTFFEGACVAHVSMAHPVCERLRNMAKNALVSLNIPYHGATYLFYEAQ